MRPAFDFGNRELLASAVFVLALLGVYFLVSVGEIGSALYYDNTSIETRVNVTNIAPVVSQVVLHRTSDGELSSIDLTEGTTTQITCNATVDDWNGYSDIWRVNATIYDEDAYSSSSSDDNNYHYSTTSCTNSSLNATALKFSCTFNVWYYANDATWNCNVTAKDKSNATHTAVDPSAPTINILAALNLSNDVLDFGEMQPGETSASDELMNVTNTGNTNINISVDGFGAEEGDLLAMKCTVGNISIELLKYNITVGQAYLTQMYNLTDTKIPAGIPHFYVPERVDDLDTAKKNSTNSTYWKLRIPIGSAGGFCNGTLTFSAVI